jgi:hypothetical protein
MNGEEQAIEVANAIGVVDDYFRMFAPSQKKVANVFFIVDWLYYSYYFSVPKTLSKNNLINSKYDKLV